MTMETTIFFASRVHPTSDLAKEAEAPPGILEEALASAECEKGATEAIDFNGNLEALGNDGCRGIWGSSRNSKL